PSQPPPTTSATGPPGSAASWSRATTLAPRTRRTTPASGVTVPASTPSNVDLPVPLMPTTPRRSPLATVTDRSVNSGLPGRLADSPWASTRITAPERTGRRRRSRTPPRCPRHRSGLPRPASAPALASSAHAQRRHPLRTPRSRRSPPPATRLPHGRRSAGSRGAPPRHRGRGHADRPRAGRVLTPRTAHLYPTTAPVPPAGHPPTPL